MRPITPVVTFTDPVNTLENGDPVDNTSTDPTSQALTNRTAELNARVGQRNTASGFAGVDANGAEQITATTGDALTVSTAASGNGIVATSAGSGKNGVLGVGTGSTAGSASGLGAGVHAVGGTITSAIVADATNTTPAVNAISYGGGGGVGVLGQCGGGGTGIGVKSAGGVSSDIGISAENLAGGVALQILGDTTSPTHAALRFIPQDTQPGGPNVVGDMYVTTAGVLKICTVAGTPGTWVSVGAQA